VNGLKVSYVSSEFIDYLYDLFEKNNRWVEHNITTNCYLTDNQIGFIPDHFKKEIHEDINDMHWLHILKFPPEGKLDWHTHYEFEKISYVLYMDDVGGTFFKINGEEVFVKSERCKLILFPSEYEHKAETYDRIRYVSAGGITSVSPHNNS
tara:strand:- start:20 stop:472 length:453 start_codon:yes stop_codon:yes gene_type:complete